MHKFMFFPLLFIFTSCTIQLQNTSTNGKAQDLINEDMSPKNDISPNVNVPVPGTL